MNNMSEYVGSNSKYLVIPELNEVIINNKLIKNTNKLNFIYEKFKRLYCVRKKKRLYSISFNTNLLIVSRLSILHI